MYAWKHSIQPFAYCSCPATQFCGLASQKCMWVSTTKYFSPSFSYTVPPPDADAASGLGGAAAARGLNLRQPAVRLRCLSWAGTPATQGAAMTTAIPPPELADGPAVAQSRE